MLSQSFSKCFFIHKIHSFGFVPLPPIAAILLASKSEEENGSSRGAKQRTVRVPCEAVGAGGAVRRDGGVHAEGGGGVDAGVGAHGGGAQPPLGGLQERDRVSACRVAHRVLHRTEGGRAQERRPRVPREALQIQGRERAHAGLRQHPQPPRLQPRTLRLRQRVQGLLLEDEGRLPPLSRRV